MFKVDDYLVYKDLNKYKNCLFKIIDDEDARARKNTEIEMFGEFSVGLEQALKGEA